MNSKLMLAVLLAGAGALVAQAQTQDQNAPNPPQSQYQQNAGPAGTPMANGPAVASLDTRQELGMLDQTSFDDRRSTIDDMRKHVNGAHRTLMKMEVEDWFHHMSPEQKAAYEQAKADQKVAYDQLEVAFKTARRSDQESWDQNRQALEQDYRQYRDAVGRMEAFNPNLNGGNMPSSRPPQ